MTCLIFMLRLFVFLTMTSLGKQEEEHYRELVLSSIQSVATLNEAVSNFVLQLAEVSTSLSEVKRNQVQIHQALDSLEQNGLNMIEKIADLTTSLALTNAKIGDTRDEVLLISGEQAAERISVIDKKIADLTTSLALTNAKIDDTRDEVLIVSGEQAAGNEKCMKVCAGSTGRSTTDWINTSSYGLYYDVDISDCGFKTVPTVTTAVEGTSTHWRTTGTSSIYNTSPSAFRMYLENTSHNPQNGAAESNKWNIEWIAVGYTC